MRKHLWFAIALWCITAATAVGAQNASGSKTVDGLTVYFGVLPAALLRGDAKQHVEEAHGDVPRGPHAYHVVAAVFDAESGRRVEDATIDARVGPLRLGSVTRRLEPMAIAGALTYGNIFTLRVDGPYQIAFIVTVPHRADPVVVEFSYEHPTP